MNWYGIWVLRALGLAWDVKLPKLHLTPQEIDSPATSVILMPPGAAVEPEAVTSGD
jgi:hypothetical protein